MPASQRSTSTASAAHLRFARVASGARIAWAAHGHGPTLVRTANWMTHVEHDLRSPIWQPWLDRLGRVARLVRYDERGCGMSSPDDTPPGLASAVEELAAVVDACGAPTVALLGMSGGAAAAVAYAARHPGRVSHLVLLGGYTHGVLCRDPSDDARQLLEAQARLIELGWGKPGSAVQQYFTTQMIPEASPEQARSLNEQQRLSCDGARAAAIHRARVALDVRDELPRVRCPVLVLHAEGDLVVPKALGIELAAAIARARFVSLPTRNHIPLAGTPAFEQLCGAIEEFLAASPDAAGERAGFTARERALLALVAQGLDNLQIASRLELADQTVRNGMSRLYAKLGVEGRPQAVVRARQLGFG